MSPGGYLRGAAALEGPPEIGARSQKSIYIALTFLALLQVACTLGLFLYVKMEPICMCDKECDKGRLKSCEGLKEALSAAVQQEIQAQSTNKQFYLGDEESSHPRNHRHHNWPIAHLTFGNSTESSQKIEQLYSWKYKEGLAHLQNMSYHNGMLTVLQDGYYFVYANVCFRRHKSTMKISQNLQNPLQLMIYVNKLTKSGQQTPLLKGGKSEVWSNDSLFNFYSVYNGGVFKLVAGEEIFIKVSNSALIDPAEDATFFGAIKVLDIYL